ncbi:unnamed protein product [Mycetohabitans rhizoxinica HKI 454]|uniref:Uncharacterized protein n=1 Tax=Mycetohabitans rhizoxinica (strain DSM 19002 / CIP 109453 / HKI 454) TaxID=882378 RepID=E5AM31_MYCRK|nr:unnamed protein product [Mycetohabitans rhizoxinica HKI 454]
MAIMVVWVSGGVVMSGPDSGKAGPRASRVAAAPAQWESHAGTPAREASQNTLF